MKDIGFLYVLANSAMPNMVKVGKTTRSPWERAAELSAATGLPTPFIVVYEQLFEHCTEAEAFVHTFLAGRGFRVADNREFFNAPANEVVRAITMASGAIDGSQVDDEDDELLSRTRVEDELDDLSLREEAGEAMVEPWQAIFDEAECNYYGLGDFIEDRTEAMRLYKQAAKLGCLVAYSRLGNMYAGGEGVREDKSRALEYFKEGARKGQILCYWDMGVLFFREGQSGRDNAEKCFRLFLDRFNGSDTTSAGFPGSDELNGIVYSCVRILASSLNHPSVYIMPAILKPFFVMMAKHIQEVAEGMVNWCNENDKADDKQQYNAVLQHIHGLLHP